MSYLIKPTTRFKKDVRLAKRRGYDLEKLTGIITRLASGEQLDPENYGHPLEGEYAGNRECHIEPGWLLIYEQDDANQTLFLVRTGTHSDLF